MFDDVDPRSPTPLYAQIAARVRVGVASEELVPGEALPSVRALARALRVNPATVVQAYRGLANDGFVDIRHGQGTFVRDIPPPRREEERAAQAKRLVRRLLQDGARLGIGADEMTEAFEAETGAKTLD
jgi:GntR family transcriptional regulator